MRLSRQMKKGYPEKGRNQVCLRVLPEPAEHVTSMAAVSTVVAPGEPVVELGQFVLPCQASLLICLPSSCQGASNI